MGDRSGEGEGEGRRRNETHEEEDAERGKDGDAQDESAAGARLGDLVAAHGGLTARGWRLTTTRRR